MTLINFFLKKITTDNHNLFMFHCVSWSFSGISCNKFKKFQCKLSLGTFPKSQVILRDAACVTTFILGCSIILYWLALQNERKVGIRGVLWFQVYRELFSGLQGCDELRQFVNVLVFKIFHVHVRYVFHGS